MQFSSFMFVLDIRANCFIQQFFCFSSCYFFNNMWCSRRHIQNKGNDKNNIFLSASRKWIWRWKNIGWLHWETEKGQVEFPPRNLLEEWCFTHSTKEVINTEIKTYSYQLYKSNKQIIPKIIKSDLRSFNDLAVTRSTVVSERPSFERVQFFATFHHRH